MEEKEQKVEAAEEAEEAEEDAPVKSGCWGRCGLMTTAPNSVPGLRRCGEQKARAYARARLHMAVVAAIDATIMAMGRHRRERE